MTTTGYVTKADTKKIKVLITDSNVENDLLNLGFIALATREFSYDCKDENSKAACFVRLNSLNIAFSAGREWSPSEVYEYLREKGLLEGTYKRLAWINQSEYRITEE